MEDLETKSRISPLPYHPRLILLMEDLETLVQNTPSLSKFGISHGGLRNLSPNSLPPTQPPKIGISHEDFVSGTVVCRLPLYPSRISSRSFCREMTTDSYSPCCLLYFFLTYYREAVYFMLNNFRAKRNF